MTGSRRIIDAHTHAFPDRVAEKAIPALEAEAIIKARLDGKVGSLLASMDRAGIEASVLASIATKPEQFIPILGWSKSIRSNRLIPFPSVHPDDPEAVEHIGQIAAEDFRGVKLHPYYQGFSIDDKKMFALYEALCESELVLLLHTGFDIAFPHDRIADPEKIVKIIGLFPDLKLITSHLGAWKDWDESERMLLGKPVYMDISASFNFMPAEQAANFMLRHPREFLLFGSDSPWEDQSKLLEDVYKLNLPEERLEALLFGNARRLLRI